MDGKHHADELARQDADAPPHTPATPGNSLRSIKTAKQGGAWLFAAFLVVRTLTIFLGTLTRHGSVTRSLVEAPSLTSPGSGARRRLKQIALYLWTFVLDYR